MLPVLRKVFRDDHYGLRGPACMIKQIESKSCLDGKIILIQIFQDLPEQQPRRQPTYRLQALPARISHHVE